MFYRRFMFLQKFNYSINSAIARDMYPLESYDVTTKDGYILTMHRLRKSKEPLKPPVLLQHGLWSSSQDWIIPSPDHGLSYLLADSGFDVWLGNSRGNKYSRRHLKFDPDKNSKDYWNFSWHEMGVHDLPAMIENILTLSKYKQIYYIGHSQGTTIFFVMASTKPEMNKYVKSMYALAPVAYLKNMKSIFLQRLATLSPQLYDILNATGYYKLLPTNGLMRLLDKILINNSERVQAFAPTLIQNLSSYASEDVKKQFVDVILTHIKCGASFKSLEHFAQCTREDACFRRFDYGLHKNIQIYGQNNPPEYNLKNISTPLYFFYSDYDWLTGSKDIELLYKTIPNKGNIVKINIPQFNHLDFIWATNAKQAFYYDIIRHLEDSQKKDAGLPTNIVQLSTKGTSDETNPLL